MCHCSVQPIVFVGPLQAATSCMADCKLACLFFNEMHTYIYPVHLSSGRQRSKKKHRQPALVPSTQNNKTMIRVDRGCDPAVPGCLSESNVWALRYYCRGLPPLFAFFFPRSNSWRGRRDNGFMVSTCHIVSPRRTPCFEALTADRHFARKERGLKKLWKSNMDE